MSTLSRLSSSMNKPPSKYTIGQYIIENLVDKGINIAYGYKNNPYSPFYQNIHQHNNFDIIFEKYEENSAYNALTYSKNTNNMGVIISTSTNFKNIMTPIEISMIEKRPLLLLSFFHPNNKPSNSFPEKSKSFIKESLTIDLPHNFPDEMECLVSYSYTFPAGPVHLNISNKILDIPIGTTTRQNLLDNNKPKNPTFLASTVI